MKAVGGALTRAVVFFVVVVVVVVVVNEDARAGRRIVDDVDEAMRPSR